MQAIAVIIQVGAGLVLLFFGVRWLLHGVLRAALGLRAPSAVTARFMLALGPAIPVTIVLATAAARDESTIAIGAVVGAQVAMVLLIVGIGAISRPLAWSRPTLFDSGALAIATLLFVFLASDGRLGVVDGGLLLFGLAVYLVALWTRRAEARTDPPGRAPAVAFAWTAALGVVCGVAALVVGAVVLVMGTVQLGHLVTLADVALGATVLAIGAGVTAPGLLLRDGAAAEMMASVGALPPAVVSLLASAGVVGVIWPLRLPPQLVRFDLWFLAASTGVAVLLLIGSQRPGRIEGGGLLLIYAVYLATQFEPLYSAIR